MSNANDFSTKEMPTWCAACGEFGILSTLKQALAELGLPSHETLVVSGIGCGSKMPHYINAYGFEGLHGRALPVATGAKLANPELNVIAVSGDGDAYGIGCNHFVHTMRRNFDMTMIVQDNAIYGLTKGQYSPTSGKGFKSVSSPFGALEEPLNPIKLAMAMGATYVARGFALDVSHLKKLIVDGIKHKGFALIDVLMPCGTYNRVNTAAWYRQRVYKLEESGHDISDINKAFEKAGEFGERIPIGLFYKADKPCYEDFVPRAKDASNIDIEPMLAKYR